MGDTVVVATLIAAAGVALCSCWSSATLAGMPAAWTPPLELDSRGDRCRLRLVGVTYGNGATIQEAANDLLTRLFDLAVGLRRGGYRFSTEAGRLDPRVCDFLWELGELVARGGDMRARVFADSGGEAGARPAA